MTWEIIEGSMTHSKEDGYLGKVIFTLEGHKSRYEITLLAKKPNDWSYSLNFTDQSGVESEIEAAEQRIEEDDDLFDALVEAAMSRLS
ncbi:MAG: hypothetical protein K0Q59_3317 [Paenibacillus sp.]|nr:hypothetical protein [Paenibacillus sp.]